MIYEIHRTVCQNVRTIYEFTERFVKTLERMFKPQELLCGMPINKKLSYFEFSITSHIHRDTTVSLTLA